MNRHARRALEAKTRNSQQGLATVAQKLQGIEALPEALRDVRAILDGMNGMRDLVAQAVRDVAAMQYRLDRQEYVTTKLLDGIYTTLGTTFGAKLNERVPYIEWNARRLVLEAEYDRKHKEAAPSAESVPET